MIKQGRFLHCSSSANRDGTHMRSVLATAFADFTKSQNSDGAADFIRREAPSTFLPNPSSHVVVISACLAGCAVTYKGDRAAGNTKHRSWNGPIQFVSEVLSEKRLGLIRLMPLCPEVDILGLPIPRNPIKLILPRDAKQLPDLVDAVTGLQLTERMEPCRDMTITSQLAQKLAKRSPHMSCSGSNIKGFILRSRSPSCGVGDARLYGESSDSKALIKDVDGAFVSRWIEQLGREKVDGGAAGHQHIAVTTEKLIRQMHSSSVMLPDRGTRHPKLAASVHCSLDSFLTSVLRLGE